MLSRGTISITGTLPALRGALLFPAQMLGGIVVSSDACSPMLNSHPTLLRNISKISTEHCANLNMYRQRLWSVACFPDNLHSPQL